MRAEAVGKMGWAAKVDAERGMVGQRVNNFQIVRLLGEGGMGAVYEAAHPTLQRRVAVKVLRPELAADGALVQRFFNEARVANSIRHPNIIEVVDMGLLPEGVPYLMMELLEGECLSHRLARQGPLPVGQAVDFAMQTAQALEAAHRHAVIHRDLKPENLVLIPDQRFPGRELVKVLDFGIAKLLGDLSATSVHTLAGTVFGTPPYMSPEQCRGSQVEIDHRSDIYALGIILYEMLCGTPPFCGAGLGDVMMMHLTHDPQPPSLLRPGLPDQLERLILRALAKSPDERFADMPEMLSALAALPAGITAPPLTAVPTAAPATIPGSIPDEAATVVAAPAVHTPPAGTGRAIGPTGTLAGATPPTPLPSAPSPSPSPPASPSPSPSSSPLRAASTPPATARVLTPVLPPPVARADWPPHRRLVMAACAGALLLLGMSAAAHLAADRSMTFPPTAPPARALPEVTALPAARPPQEAMPAPAPPAPPAPAPTASGVRTRTAREQPARRPAQGRRKPGAVAAAAGAEGAGAESAGPAAAAETPTSGEPGYLSLDSAPWANVTLGGRHLGSTPLIRTPLPPGRHTLTLSNPELGASTTYVVEIKAGAALSRFVGWEK
jgi:serine/threonine protein kinase